MKIGAKVVAHGRYPVFRMAGVAVPSSRKADVPPVVGPAMPAIGERRWPAALAGFRPDQATGSEMACGRLRAACAAPWGDGPLIWEASVEATSDVRM